MFQGWTGGDKFGPGHVQEQGFSSIIIRGVTKGEWCGDAARLQMKGNCTKVHLEDMVKLFFIEEEYR